MILLFIMQAITALIVMRIRPMREAYRWIVVDLVLCCMWDTSFIIRDTLVPLLRENGYGGSALHTFLLRSSVLLEFTGEILNPYAGLMFALAYSEFAVKTMKRILAVILLTPCVYMAFATPFRPELHIDYTRMVIWVGVYYAGIFTLLIAAVVKASDPRIRRNRMLTACVCIPPMLGDYAFNHLAQAYHLGTRQYQLLEAFILVSFLLFVGFAARYGVFGVRILIQKQRMDYTLRSLNSGSVLLNHAIKNSLINIELLAGRAEERYVLQEGVAENGSDLVRIREETRSLMAMMERIHRQSQDIEMKKSPESIADLLTGTVNTLKPRMEEQGVKLLLELEPVPVIQVDRVHVQEMLRNLLSNAMEAMEAGTGRLEVRCENEGRWIRVTVSDNGAGISKEVMPHIFDPFFSTKRRSDNFGLGLSYCYMVVQKHGGDITATSEPGKGTTFVIRFPLMQRAIWMLGRSRPLST